MIKWNHVVGGIVGAFMLLAGYGAWLIGQANAAVSDHVADPNPHPGIETRFLGLDQKLDKVLWYLIEEQKRDAEAPKPNDPVPPWIKRF